jgi:hypothetical protein
MQNRIKALFAGLSALAAVSVVVWDNPLQPLELPFPGHLRHREVFPEAELDSVIIGSRIAAEYRRFGKNMPAATALPEARCVNFRYDPDLVDYPTSLMFLVRDGTIEQKWLMEKATPLPCDRLPTDIVELTGYYDAAWCCSWPGAVGAE